MSNQAAELLLCGKVIQEPYKDFSQTLSHPDFSGEFTDTAEGLWELAEELFSKFKKANCMAWRTQHADQTLGAYEYWSYEEVARKVEHVAYGLASVNTGEDNNVGIWSSNCPQWMICFVACWRQGKRFIPFYDTLGVEAMAYIMKTSQIVVLFTESSRLSAILDLVKSNKDHIKLETIVIIDSEHCPDMIEDFAIFDLKLVMLSEFMDAQACFPTPISGNGIAMIMYTSGTSGKPKGVLLSHKNFTSAGATADSFLAKFPEAVKNLRHYSYLPLAHIMEAGLESSVLINGGCIYYSSGDIKRLTEELGMIRPTIFVGVPRVYQKIYDKVMLQSQSGLTGFLLRMSLSDDGLLSMLPGMRWLYNNFLSIVNWKIGLDQCQLFWSGGAPLPNYLHKFLLILFHQGKVLQGYGLTETTGVGTMVIPGDLECGHTGGPNMMTHIKLRDVPEMNRLHTNNPPDGEIFIGGPTVFQGYYKNKEETSKTLIEEGEMKWVATGDIGVIRQNGSIKIVDRKKNIFKLAQGEYIAVEKIEMEYSKCMAVNQIWVYGNSFKSCIVAVINPSIS